MTLTATETTDDLDRIIRYKTRFAPHQRTLPELLRRQAKAHGNRVLVRFAGGAQLTFAEAQQVAAAAAATLDRAGVGPGDRVAMLCGNHADFIRLYLGCAWRGAIAVPINTASMGLQLEHILTNCGAGSLPLMRNSQTDCCR